MDIKKVKEIELHKELADEYHLRYKPDFAKTFQTNWNEQLLKHLDKAKNYRVLDYGTGTGILLKDLKKRYNTVCGFDISHDMLKKIPKDLLIKTGEIVVSDGEALPYKLNSFNAVVCKGVLHHLSDIPLALKEIKRVLNKGGVLILSEPCNDFFPIRLARKILYKKSAKFEESDEGFFVKNIEEMLFKEGFIIEKKSKFGFLSYIFAGFPDILPLLKYIPFNVILTRCLILMDKFLMRFPLIQNLGFQLIITAKSRIC